MRFDHVCGALAIVTSFAAQAAAPASSAKVIMHGPQSATQAILAAEDAFDARSQAVGPAQAMREYMDPVDGLSFAGGEPARGAAAIYAAHGGAKPAGSLSWVPAEVYAAAFGDMGATWGHFRFVPPGGGKVMTGHYVTVWRMKDGKWKGLLDIGSPD